MKMPTAVVRHRTPPWKPGNPVSVPIHREGTLLSDERLPVVTSTTNGHSPRHRPPDSGKHGGAEKGKEMVVVTSSAPTSGQGDRTKRFPILGPTRQDTELYFRRRRSARNRIRSHSRPLVTRSTDRVVPADCSPAVSLTFSSNPTATAISISTTTIVTACNSIDDSHRVFRHVDNDYHDRYSTGSSVDTSRSGFSFYNGGHGSQSVTASLPVFDGRSGISQVGASNYLPRFERAGSSPAVIRTSLPSFDRSYSFHIGTGGAGGGGSGSGGAGQEMVRSGGGGGGSSSNGKKLEIPIKFLSESGKVRASELMHRVQKPPKDQQQGQRTLQPSKYGFHRRSKSPTFKRLVAVVEKLQIVSTDSDSDSHHTDSCNVCAAARVTSSSDAIRLPTVPGIVDGDDEDGVGGGERGTGGGAGVGERDEDVTYVEHNDFLSSAPHSKYRHHYHHHYSKTPSRKSKHGNTNANSNNSKRLSLASKKGPTLNNSFAASPPGELTDIHDLSNGWGAWEVDSLSVDSGLDPRKVTLPFGPAPADAHTELHLFLPRLADTPCEESWSVSASKASPERHNRPRFAENRTSNSLGLHRGKTMSTIHPHTSHRPPQHPYPNSYPLQVQSAAGGGDRNSRSQSKRFTSPVRPGKRDRTPSKPRAAASAEVYEPYEPFIKGEHLKEKLEDFPTLISLDQD
ncbi:uncharacterized protein [Littorina saxatilis]|uniref:Uncharacterized protein n=1 Tax=Littorina saxatilis TaxID=31220 RepID=A0AAN9GI21_9CAEN